MTTRIKLTPALLLCAVLAVSACKGDIGAGQGPSPKGPGQDAGHDVEDVSDPGEDVGDPGEDVGEDAGEDTGPPAPFKISTKAQLNWKRATVMNNDLARALELPPAEVCLELDRFGCASVHLLALGGNEPFNINQYEPLPEPLATTPAATDRLVIAACTQRAEMDAEASAVVFTELALDGDAPAADDAATTATITELYRRLLSRDPTPEEIAKVAELVVDDDGQPVSALDFAKLSCFAIGTTTEFLFY